MKLIVNLTFSRTHLTKHSTSDLQITPGSLLLILLQDEKFIADQILVLHA